MFRMLAHGFCTLPFVYLKESLVNVEIPTEIVVDGFLKNVNNVRAHHCDMVLETVLADELHQLLQVVNLSNGDATVHSIRVVGQLALAEIALYAAKVVVGRDTEISELAFGALAVNCAERVNLAERAAEHSERTELEVVLHETWVHTHLLRSSAKLLFQSSSVDGRPAARLRAYIDTAPATSVSQAHGMSFSPSMLIVTQAAQP